MDSASAAGWAALGVAGFVVSCVIASVASGRTRGAWAWGVLGPFGWIVASGAGTHERLRVAADLHREHLAALRRLHGPPAKEPPAAAVSPGASAPGPAASSPSATRGGARAFADRECRFCEEVVSIPAADLVRETPCPRCTRRQVFHWYCSSCGGPIDDGASCDRVRCPHCRVEQRLP
jgi:hypothetical protein